MNKRILIIIFVVLIALGLLMLGVLGYWMMDDKESQLNNIEIANEDAVVVEEETGDDLEEYPVKDNQGLDNRVLVIVMEDNSVLLPQVERFYAENKFVASLILSMLFEVDRQELANKTFSDIIDDYGEEYLASKFAESAEGYPEIIVLSDNKATFDNFVKVVKELNQIGKTIDILIDLHGSPGIYYFYDDDPIYKDDVVSAFKDPVNIGFVYQTVCYSGSGAEFWIDIGADVASGSKGANDFVLLAPQKFLSSWIKGDSYYKSVQKGFNYELNISQYVNSLVSGVFFSADPESVKESEMIFYGNLDYALPI